MERVNPPVLLLGPIVACGVSGAADELVVVAERDHLLSFPFQIDFADAAAPLGRVVVGLGVGKVVRTGLDCWTQVTCIDVLLRMAQSFHSGPVISASSPRHARTSCRLRSTSKGARTCQKVRQAFNFFM